MKTTDEQRPLTLGVVVTNCDTWKLTLACLEKVAPLRGALADVLVVDDASADRGPEVLPAGTRLLRNPTRSGFARTLNRGLRELAAEIAVVFDSDAYPLGDFTQEVQRLFSADPRLAIAGFRTVGRDGRETGSHQPEPGAATLVLGQRLHALWERLAGNPESICVASGAMAVRRAVSEALGGLDEG